MLILYTGDGKGKTTAALGLALRAVGHGKRVAFVQFIKCERVGEHEAAARLAPELEIFRCGCGFVVGEPAPEHRAAAREALERVRSCLADGRHDVVVADEILVAAGLGLVTRDDVESLAAARPVHMHLVLTGRGAWPGIIDLADIATEMRNIRHPGDAGAAPQEGVEF
jgi:cob(I)alamin adenosyltransferase